MVHNALDAIVKGHACRCKSTAQLNMLGRSLWFISAGMGTLGRIMMVCTGREVSNRWMGAIGTLWELCGGGWVGQGWGRGEEGGGGGRAWQDENSMRNPWTLVPSYHFT